MLTPKMRTAKSPSPSAPRRAACPHAAAGIRPLTRHGSMRTSTPTRVPVGAACPHAAVDGTRDFRKCPSMHRTCRGGLHIRPWQLRYRQCLRGRIYNAPLHPGSVAHCAQKPIKTARGFEAAGDPFTSWRRVPEWRGVPGRRARDRTCRSLWACGRPGLFSRPPDCRAPPFWGYSREGGQRSWSCR